MKNIVSQYLPILQQNFFPDLEKHAGKYSQQHISLVEIIAFAGIDGLQLCQKSYTGRPAECRLSFFRAFLAKSVFNLPTTVALIDRLQCDVVLRRICGYEKCSQIPSESSFSRAFAEFAEYDIVNRVHENVIKNYLSEELILHIARDATAIEAREKITKKPDTVIEIAAEKKKLGRPKKGEERPKKPETRLEKQPTMSLKEMLADLPKDCDVGCKKNSKGFTSSWKGYKLHIDVADGDIPISAVLTSASLHDSQVAIPLAKLTNERVTHCYSLMDAAYDSDIIRAHETSQGHVALIDYNNRSAKEKRSFLPHEALRYKARSGVERVNSYIKDNYGAVFVRVRGYKKVFTHLMFGVLAVAIKQILALSREAPA